MFDLIAHLFRQRAFSRATFGPGARPEANLMDEQMMPKLLSCPFCGSDMSSFAGMTPDAFAKGEGTFAINCDCGATGPLEPTMQEAVDAWNTRAPAQNQKTRCENCNLLARCDDPLCHNGVA